MHVCVLYANDNNNYWRKAYEDRSCTVYKSCNCKDTIYYQLGFSRRVTNIFSSTKVNIIFKVQKMYKSVYNFRPLYYNEIIGRVLKVGVNRTWLTAETKKGIISARIANMLRLNTTDADYADNYVIITQDDDMKEAVRIIKRRNIRDYVERGFWPKCLMKYILPIPGLDHIPVDPDDSDDGGEDFNNNRFHDRIGDVEESEPDSDTETDTASEGSSENDPEDILVEACH